MRWSDNTEQYGAISRFNHWIGAILLIVLLGIGLYFHEMPKGDERSFWLHWHISLAVLFWLLLMFRVLWRLVAKSPAPLPQPLVVQRLTKAVQGIMLLALLILLISGPLMVWSADRPLQVFDWFAIPSPLGSLESLHEILEAAHKISSRVLLFAILLHVAGVLKHALLERAPIMRRMLG